MSQPGHRFTDCLHSYSSHFPHITFSELPALHCLNNCINGASVAYIFKIAQHGAIYFSLFIDELPLSCLDEGFVAIHFQHHEQVLS